MKNLELKMKNYGVAQSATDLNRFASGETPKFFIHHSSFFILHFLRSFLF